MIALDTQTGKHFGFQLRNDTKLPARQEMLDPLRDAFERNLSVNIDFTAVAGKNNSVLSRGVADAPVRRRPRSALITPDAAR